VNADTNNDSNARTHSHAHFHEHAHERARQLIALSGPEALPGYEASADKQSPNAWLAAHLETCASCRLFAENAAETIHGLRAIPIAAERSLVTATQMRVRRRALELQRSRERVWLVSMSCTAVTLCALLSTVALWRGFEWLGTRAQLDSSVWRVGLLVFCVMPALVAAMLLIAKGSQLSDHTGSYEG
jgi:predicted anti-sigma-YlaC factor YlaD